MEVHSYLPEGIQIPNEDYFKSEYELIKMRIDCLKNTCDYLITNVFSPFFKSQARKRSRYQKLTNSVSFYSGEDGGNFTFYIKSLTKYNTPLSSANIKFTNSNVEFTVGLPIDSRSWFQHTLKLGEEFLFLKDGKIMVSDRNLSKETSICFNDYCYLLTSYISTLEYYRFHDSLLKEKITEKFNLKYFLSPFCVNLNKITENTSTLLSEYSDKQEYIDHQWFYINSNLDLLNTEVFSVFLLRDLDKLKNNQLKDVKDEVIKLSSNVYLDIATNKFLIKSEEPFIVEDLSLHIELVKGLNNFSIHSYFNKISFLGFITKDCEKFSYSNNKLDFKFILSWISLKSISYNEYIKLLKFIKDMLQKAVKEIPTIQESILKLTKD